ncbi:MAG TPA: serine hydrolase [Stellaceae bacterium]|nr:serine hydrolase [Stellaceae bacterium]
MRYFIPLVAALLLGSLLPAHARYSSIVIDAQSGEVLSEVDADAENYPASLTKMMTLYLAFAALEKGEIALDQRLTVSAHAAHQKPSRLGLEAEETVTVRDLILGMVTKSANDAAVVMAETLADSEEDFAAMMTREAHRLGMKSTIFHNASGLANPGQHSTARDLALLARHLYRDFPREYAYFATEEFTYKGETFSNHNRLMRSFAGMDGIKTGYIHESGFNLAASAVRHHHRLIAVVMGGRTARTRDRQMSMLLNHAFAGMAGEEKSFTHRAIAALSPISAANAAEPEPTPTKPRHHHAALRAAGNDRGWSIQVGAFKRQDAARSRASATIAKLPGGHRGKTMEVVSAHGHKKTIYEARIVHLSHKEAQAACQVLHRKHQACAVVGPHATEVAVSRTKGRAA